MKAYLVLLAILNSLLQGKTFVLRPETISRQTGSLLVHKDSDNCIQRRSLLSETLSPFLAVALLSAGEPANAASVEPSSRTKTEYESPDQAQITHKVFFKVRISRQDGTFYVRDDLPDTPENRVFYATLKIGLFGKNAPNHVQQFLSYIPTASSSSVNEDDEKPSYGRSQFTRFDQATGVLWGGSIPSLTAQAWSDGSTVLRYGSGRLLPAPLWLEKGTTAAAISHTNSQGLLTHAALDVTPTFGITTRRDTALDGTHTVFGKLLLTDDKDNDDDMVQFLSLVQDLPTYGLDRPRRWGYDDYNDSSLVDEAASAVFAAQRDFFRSAAKNLGDSRLDKVYEGKLLRRVEVTQVGLL